MVQAISRIWRSIKQRYNLEGVHCEVCKESFFPKRTICPNCRRKGKLVDAKMPHTGKIYSYSLVYSAPAGFEYEVPYFVAIIELDNKVKIFSQVVDSEVDKVKIGAKVKAVFRRVQAGKEEDVIAYGYKFTVV
ncbi:MAG: Zn-ribbon domain-containing OB-fold protein [Candidatus Micrarchaeota archaeon]|nr:Zn-ribbon domain-containing OB-fold protein [Candidatus Micrarchaeota archaeon]